MESTHTSYLDIPDLSEASLASHVFPDTANSPLLSVGQLCNEGYSVTFKIDVVTLFNTTGKAILKGQRDAGTGLWHINACSETPQTQNC
jgi:hypothetical protein